MKKLIVFFCLCSLIITSCYFDKEEELYPNSNCNITSVTYSKEVSIIINTKCATSGCHVAGGVFPNLSNYNALNSNIQRVKARAIDAKTMPPASSMQLTDCDYKQLSKWINDGAQNN